MPDDHVVCGKSGMWGMFKESFVRLSASRWLKELRGNRNRIRKERGCARKAQEGGIVSRKDKEWRVESARFGVMRLSDRRVGVLLVMGKSKRLWLSGCLAKITAIGCLFVAAIAQLETKQLIQ